MATSDTTIISQFTGTFTNGSPVKVPAWVVPFLHEHIREELHGQGSLQVQRDSNVNLNGFHHSPYTRNDGVSTASRRKDRGMVVFAVDQDVRIEPDETVCVKLNHHEYAPLTLSFTRPSYATKA